MDTSGNTGNEGGMGNNYDGGYVDTFGVQGNEPSQHRSDTGRGDDGSSYQPSQNYGGQNGGSQNTGQSWGSQVHQGNSQSSWGYNGTGSSGNPGNQPSRHSNGYHTNTFGTIGNQPGRHRDIDIYVQPPNKGPVSMTASLGWTLDKLHSESARRCSIDSSQCHSTCRGMPLKGSRKVHEIGVQKGSTVVLNMRLRGG